jgi:hypothetical protein
MTDPTLYRVTVTQKWSATADALVWAYDENTARRLAIRGVKVDIDDATPCNLAALAKPEPLDEDVLDRMNDDDLCLIMPDGQICESGAGLAQFQSLVSLDQLEALRLARIEAGNGQLTLVEVAA